MPTYGIRVTLARTPNATLRSGIVQSPPDKPAGHAAELAHGETAYLSWARLLQRAFASDIARCPHCGGRVKDLFGTTPALGAQVEAPQVRGFANSTQGAP